MRLSQLAPLPVRRAVWRSVERTLVPKARPVDRPTDGPIVVAGMFSTANGLGESARLCLSALREGGLEPLAFDTSSILGQVDCTPDHPTIDRLPDTRRGMLIVHANAPELGRVLLYSGRRSRRDWRCASVWAWETPMQPPGWIQRADTVNELWFPSRFVQQAICAPPEIPTLKLFHPVMEPRRAPSTEVIVEKGPLVLTCYADAHSSFERKNPIGAIRAFRQAFGASKDVCLVVKTRNASARPRAAQALALAIGDAPNILHLDRAMDQDSLGALRERTDILVSLHRSEGFGLVIAEAMRTDTPVIATDWSAPSEYLSNECAGLAPARTIPAVDPYGVYPSKGHVWADPDLEAAAKEMKRMVEERDLARRRAARARERAALLFGAGRYCEEAGFLN